MKIVIDDKIPFIKGAFESKAEVVYLPGKKISREIVKDADALVVRTRTKCNRDLLEGSSVKFIATATIGYDHIDTKYCETAGISWTNAPGCNSSSVEQYIVSAMLYLANMEDLDLKDLVVGIIGVGNVGSKVSRALTALGCQVLLNDPPRAGNEGSDAFCELDELLGKSDVVTMHVPLEKSGAYPTFEMANEAFFEKLNKGTIFINSSRGEVVNESALKNAIKQGKVSNAVLDVFQGEPKLDMELLSLLTLATPHIAGYSTDGKANGTRMSVQAVSRFFNLGLDSWEPKNVPPPSNANIFIEGEGNEELDVLTEVYSQTYNIFEDHNRLVDDVNSFEKLRGNYRIRREPAAYNVRIFNDDGKYREIFEKLGFSVIGDSCF